MMYQYIFFDLDGTLTDSKEGILNCLRYAFEKLGDPVPPETELIKFIGPPLQDSFMGFCGYSQEKAIRAVELFRERYAPIGKFENAAAPGMAELLRRLQERGYVLALASSNGLSIVEKILTDNGIRPYFEVVVSGESFRRSKPDPEIYLHTASCLGVEPQRCLVAEDSTAGITAAHLAGMRVAAVVDDRFGFDRSLADYEVKQISDILQLVEGKTDEKTGGQDK